MPTFSLVIPVLNEDETIPELYRRVKAVSQGIDGTLQIIFVDDGSRDRSLELIRALHRSDPAVSYVSLARSFGHQNAITAGLRFSRADAVVVMDSDLQDPPELIPALIERWRAGFQVVYAQRTRRRRASPIKSACAYLFYRAFGPLTNIDIPRDTGDFCLMDRRVVDALVAMPERGRYLRGLRAWTGFRSVAVPFERDARFAGRTKYTYGKLIGLAADGVVSFSRAPLRLATYVGLLAAALAVAAIAAVGYWYATGTATDRIGVGMLLAAVLFIGAVQLVCVGILGEYIGRIHEGVQGRPLYTVQETAGVDAIHPAPPDRP